MHPLQCCKLIQQAVISRRLMRRFLRQFGMREEAVHVLRRRAHDAPCLGDERLGGDGGYAASSFRTMRVPSTIAASFWTASSTVRVLSPQSGET